MTAYRATTDINSIVIHCADTPNGALWHADDINAWHREFGFKRDPLAIATHRVSPHLPNIGYHYVIETSGFLVRGRALEEIGAHAKGHNRHSIGICLVGRDAYTIDQWHVLKMLVSGLQVRFGKQLAIVGHNNLNADKTCPGFDVQAWAESGMQIPMPHLFLPAQHITDA